MKLKAPLSQSIEKEYKQLIALLAQIPAKERTQKVIEGTGGVTISIADLIAYQIGWGTLLINWYEAGLKNQIPEMPGQGFTKWHYDEIAKHFYKKYHFDGDTKQELELKLTVHRILEIVETEYKTGNLDKIGVWQWCTLKSGKKWPLSKWIQVNTVAPYKRAIIIIKKL